MGRIRLPVIPHACRIKSGVSLLPGNGADGSGFIHPVSYIDGPLFRYILRFHPLGKLIRDCQGDRALLDHGGDDFLRQMLCGRNQTRPSCLGNIISLGNNVSAASGPIFSLVFLIGKEKISFRVAVYGPACFFPSV